MPTSVENSESLTAFEATLPEAPQPLGSYVPVVQVGDLVYTSDALPTEGGALKYAGALGSFTVSVADGQQAARLCCMNLLAALKAHLGSLSRVARVVKLTGYVESTPHFYNQAQVINGASDLLVEVFGENGRHARTSIGVASLPRDASVELDLIVQVQ